MRADLGKFTLGSTALGSSIKTLTEYETLGLTETPALSVDVQLTEALGLSETTKTALIINILETLGMTEKYRYLSEYLAGVLGRITVILDITNEDFCDIVLEGGQTITLNGVLERAFVFVKQSGQKFDHGREIKPGDAVMFTCPDLGVAVGDEVVFNGELFEVADNIDHFYDGNKIYTKSALQKVRLYPKLPPVYNLVASPNYEGKTRLTWNPIEDKYPIDHYEIWESLSPITTDAIDTINIGTTETEIILTTAYATGLYSVGQYITIQGSDDNDGQYIVTDYTDNGGKAAIKTSSILKSTSTTGDIYNLKNYYIRDTTKSTNQTIRNLTANVVYYYMVRGKDPYGNPGWWSNEASTAIDTTGPPAPEGVR